MKELPREIVMLLCGAGQLAWATLLFLGRTSRYGASVKQLRHPLSF